MKNFEIENLYHIEKDEVEQISGGDFWKDLGYFLGTQYDSHHCKHDKLPHAIYIGGKWSQWG